MLVACVMYWWCTCVRLMIPVMRCKIDWGLVGKGVRAGARGFISEGTLTPGGDGVGSREGTAWVEGWAGGDVQGGQVGGG
jgi:hypothetical protein